MKPTYLVGTRGTGKTTLLHALSWRERWFSRSLRRQLGSDVFAKGYVGVYLKLPRYELARVEQWLMNEDTNDRGSIVGLYVDLIWLELLADGLVELLLLRAFKADPAAEHDLVGRILAGHAEVKASLVKTEPLTLKQFANVIRRLRREIENSARLKRSPQHVLQTFPMGQVGEFGRSVAKLLAQFCNKYAGNNNGSWYFKIAMDEAECLTPFQQRVLNTAVRLSERPVSFVVSYVRLPEDTTTTLVPHLSLQQADRHLIVLDDLTDIEFQHLAEGVATVRIQTQLQNRVARFNAVRLLGKLDIDELIEGILKSSVNPKAKELLTKADQLRMQPFLADISADNRGTSLRNRRGKKRPLLYKIYLIDRLKISIPSPGDKTWRRRRQDSAELRKKIVAAYLSICRELDVQVRYGFADMVFQMSDKCVRDFLAQMHEIFQEANRDLNVFLRKSVPLNKQDRALKRASKQKKDSIPKSGVASAPEIGRLVDGLGQITAIVQTSGPDYASLRSPERGRFRLNTTNGKETSTNSHLLELVAEAAEAGFLRVIKQEPSVWEFQVHCSLAAEYGFSYRGAYYPTVLTFDDLQALCKDGDSTQRQAILKQIVAKLNGQGEATNSRQMGLL